VAPSVDSENSTNNQRYLGNYYFLSRTVSKLRLIIGQIFPSDGGGEGVRFTLKPSDPLRISSQVIYH